MHLNPVFTHTVSYPMGKRVMHIYLEAYRFLPENKENTFVFIGSAVDASTRENFASICKTQRLPKTAVIAWLGQAYIQQLMLAAYKNRHTPLGKRN